VVVTATNIGRAPVSVASWAIEVGPTSLSGGDELGVNPSLPVRLDGHAQAHFIARATQIVGIGTAIRQGRVPRGMPAVDTIRGSVSPAVGKPVVSDWFKLKLVDDLVRASRRA
jgi:hypothetical protein